MKIQFSKKEIKISREEEERSRKKDGRGGISRREVDIGDSYKPKAKNLT